MSKRQSSSTKEADYGFTAEFTSEMVNAMMNPLSPTTYGPGKNLGTGKDMYIRLLAASPITPNFREFLKTTTGEHERFADYDKVCQEHIAGNSNPQSDRFLPFLVHWTFEANDNWPALHWAVCTNSTELVSRVLDQYANIDVRDINHWISETYSDSKRTALHLAAIEGVSSAIVKLILEKATKEYIDKVDSPFRECGRTAVSYAIEKGHDKIALLLTESGAEIDSHNL